MEPTEAPLKLVHYIFVHYQPPLLSGMFYSSNFEHGLPAR